MKRIVIKLIMAVGCITGLAFIKHPGNTGLIPLLYRDTVPSLHVTDGLVPEWSADKFIPDVDTTIFFAADNDDKNLYVVLTIPDFSMQSKVMRNGMKLFIDLKGKKKEGHGIEFPISGEVNSFMKGRFPETTQAPAAGETDGSQPKKEFDKKTARSIMALGVVALKIFGLPGASSDDQGLSIPGSVNVAFKWDAADEMHIEYSIPLKMIDESSPFDPKEVTLGWKVNGYQAAAQQEREMTGGEGRGRRGGGGGYGGGMRGGDGGMGAGMGGSSRGFNGSSGRPQRRMSMAEMMKEQSFWTKYSFVIGVGKKAF